MPKPSAHAASTTLVLLAVGLVLGFYAMLPDPMPTHWNLVGTADGFTPKPLGPFILPLVMSAVQLVFVIVRRVWRGAYAQGASREVLAVVQLSIVGFLFVVTVASLLVALGVALPWNRVLTVSLGGLVLSLGRVMGKIEKNPWVGIRTPWTLASAEVWQQTHRMGGRMFVVAGLISTIGGGLGLDLLPILIALGIAAVAPAFYSFRLYRRLEGNKPPRPT